MVSAVSENEGRPHRALGSPCRFVPLRERAVDVSCVSSRRRRGCLSGEEWREFVEVREDRGARIRVRCSHVGVWKLEWDVVRAKEIYLE